MKLTKVEKINIVVIILGSIFILLSAFHSNTWFDEAFTIGMGNQSFYDIWQICGNDVHPVLYYYMIKIILSISNGSIIACRLFSVVGTIIFGVLGYTHIRKDFGEKVGLLFSFFAYFLPMQATYAVEIRMYSWAMLFTAMLLIYAYRISKNNNKKDFYIFSILCVTCMYIHYYSLVIALIINLILLVYFLKNKNKKSKKIIILSLVLVILYIPWIKNCISQLQYVSKGYWITFEFPYTIIELLSYQMIGRLDYNIGFIASIFIYVYLIYMIIKQKNIKIVYLSIGIYISTIVIMLIISLFLNTLILYYRYLTILMGIYIFIMSYLLAREKNKKVIIFICSIILIISIMNNIKLIEENYDKSNDICIEYLKNNIQENDIFVHSDIDNASKIVINFTENKHYFYQKENWGVEEIYDVFKPQMEIIWAKEDFLDNYKGRIWFINSRNQDVFFEICDNPSYEYLENKEIEEKYRGYYYSIILVNKE